MSQQTTDADNDLRLNERTVAPPKAQDAGLEFIGNMTTPWTSKLECPRQGRHDGPLCKIEVFEPWAQALQGIEEFSQIEVLYWLHQSRRDLIFQSPANNGEIRGTFSIRSPIRPNPIGTSIVKLEKREGNILYVRGLDCLNDTPLLDLKPERTAFKPLAAPQQGDFEICP
ncbi:tRNA (N6-threonylcarbamoyladenosine(37)-N6)-methyltransferase TrmO [Brucellaceae bacterium C25G]